MPYKGKMRCLDCFFYNYSPVFGFLLGSKCGLHGLVTVDPLGVQVDLNHKGDCGFFPRVVHISDPVVVKPKCVQLEINWDDL